MSQNDVINAMIINHLMSNPELLANQRHLKKDRKGKGYYGRQKYKKATKSPKSKRTRIALNDPMLEEDLSYIPEMEVRKPRKRKKHYRGMTITYDKHGHMGAASYNAKYLGMTIRHERMAA